MCIIWYWESSGRKDFFNIKSNVPSPIDQRGKHTNRKNKITERIKLQIKTHILNFPRYISNYSRSDNQNKRYLSTELSIAKIYNLYIEKYEPDIFEKLKRSEIVKPIVKYEFFSKYFNENLNFSFGRPKSDTCQTCDKLTNTINSEKAPEIKRTLIEEKNIHLDKSKIFYTDLKELTKESRQNNEIEVLTIF